MIAGDSDIAGPAFELAGDVIASRLRRHVFRALFLAVQAEISVRTFLVACSSSPASFTEALASCWIARRVVLAIALMLAFSSVEAQRTRAFATNAGIFNRLTSFELGFAQTFSVHWVAGVRLLLLANALEGAVLTKEPRIAFLLARFARPARSAITFTGSWMAAAVVQAFAGF